MNSTGGYVVTAINGGLGNQMFQYAAGRRLAHINGKELLLYLGERYRPGSYRTYRLDRFHVAGRIATAGEAGGLKKASRTRQRLGKFFPTFATPEDRQVVQEASLPFDPGILCLRGNVKLNGYWQCESYFSDIAGIVRKDFTLRDGLTGRDRDVLDRIRSGPSAFIHVRRLGGRRRQCTAIDSRNALKRNAHFLKQRPNPRHPLVGPIQVDDIQLHLT